MSDAHYTKKAEIGNSPKEAQDTGQYGQSVEVSPEAMAAGLPKAKASVAKRFAVLWYELGFLYKSRAEKCLLLAVFVMGLSSSVALVYLGKKLQEPAPITMHCPDSYSEEDKGNDGSTKVRENSQKSQL